MKYKLSKRSLSRSNGVKSILIAVFVDAIINSPYDFGIAWHGGKRTAGEQYLLYSAGRSLCDGYKKRSKHQDGKALDFFVIVDGKVTQKDEEAMSSVARHIQKIGRDRYKINLQWGGDWSKIHDLPHIQMK